MVVFKVGRGIIVGTLTINAVYGTSVTSLNNDGTAADQSVYNGYTSAVNTVINFFETNFQTLGTTDVAFSIDFGYGSIPNADLSNGSPVTDGAATSFSPQILNYSSANGDQPSFYSIISSAYNSTTNANATALQTGAISNGIIPSTSPFGVNGGVVVLTEAQEALLSPSYYLTNFGTTGTYVAASIGLQTNTPANGDTPASTWVWSELGGFPASTDTVSYQDAVSTLEHEISEAMGRGTDGGVINPTYSPLPEYRLEDFFAYTAAVPPPVTNPAGAAAFGSAVGVQDIPGQAIPDGNGGGVQTYFSPNGGTITLPFRSPTDSTGNDLGDWGTNAQQATQVVSGQTLIGTDSFAGEGSGLNPLSPTDILAVELSDGLVPTSVSCFASGTKITTSRGAVAVEDLKEGDYARTAAGGTSRIQWIGHRRIDCTRHPRPGDVMPIRVARDGFRRGHPSRDLLLSPDHSVFVDGVLIPVRHLVNGATIRQEAVDAVTYWHVKLTRHDVLLAEGLPCESYLDTGNREAFANSPVTALHPSFGYTAAQAWAFDACAPLKEAGAEVNAVRARLAARATELGYSMRAMRDVVISETGTTAVTIGAEVEVVRLVSASSRPDKDTRRVGALLTGWHMDGVACSLDDARLGLGFHEPETHAGSRVRWTDGSALLTIGAAGVERELRIDIAALKGETASVAAA
jgi:hypothetical protein